MIYDKQAFRIPSNLAQPEIGCMICARQAFRVPSDSAQTEDGCRASTRQAFSRAIRFGDKPKRMEKVPEKYQKSIRKVSEMCQKAHRKALSPSTATHHHRNTRQ